MPIEFKKSELDPSIFGPILTFSNAFEQSILTELSTAAQEDAPDILLRATTRKTKKTSTEDVLVKGHYYPQLKYGEEDHQPAILPTPIVSSYQLGEHITLSQEIYDRYDEIYELLLEDAPDDIKWDVRTPKTHYQKLQATELGMDYPPHTDIFAKLFSCVVYLEPRESVPTSFHGKHLQPDGPKKRVASGFDWAEFEHEEVVPWAPNCGYLFKASNYSYHSYKNDTGELRWIYMANVQ